MGASVRLIAPPTLLPDDTSAWPVDLVTSDMAEGLRGVDAVITLRIQLERQDSAYFPNAREYARLFGLNESRLSGAQSDVTVLHPGPMNRGIEISSELADNAKFSVITNQVTNGVAVRMATLFWLMGGQK